MAGQRFAKSQSEPAWVIDTRPEETKRALIDRLGETIARMEERGPCIDVSQKAGQAGGRATVSFGIDAIDAALGGGLALNALHEVRAETVLDLPAAAGFALAVGGMMAGFAAPVFWIAERQARQEAGGFYGPGLAALGLEPNRLIRIFAGHCEQALWAAGEVAACRGAGLCVLELRGNPVRADLAFSRRLALRTQANSVPVILLRQSGEEEASAAATRWRVSPAPSIGGEGEKWVGPAVWKVALEKCRGGRPGEWKLEWRHDARLFVPCADTRHAGKPSFTTGTPLSGGEPAADCDRPYRADALGGRLAQRRAS